MMAFDSFFGPDESPEVLADGAMLLRGFARTETAQLLKSVEEITRLAPFREMRTQGGLKMSLMSTGCGDLGWLNDNEGAVTGSYHIREQELPPMPEIFLTFAKRAAEAAGYKAFRPNACLINRYFPGAKLGLHQDRDESDLKAPIVSVSLGLPVNFLFGGVERSDPKRRIPLDHGDVVVWGGASRMAFHGVLTVKEGSHPLLGRQRINLTFRKVS